MRKPAVLFLLLTLLRIGFGSFFIVTGTLKIPQLDVTAEFLTRSRLLPEFCSLPLASLGVAMEIIVGICLLLRKAYMGAAFWGGIMTLIFFLLYMQAWIRGQDLTCNCVGAAHHIVNYPLDTGLRLLLLVGMSALIWDALQKRTDIWKFRALEFEKDR